MKTLNILTISMILLGCGGNKFSGTEENMAGNGGDLSFGGNSGDSSISGGQNNSGSSNGGNENIAGNSSGGMNNIAGANANNAGNSNSAGSNSAGSNSTCVPKITCDNYPQTKNSNNKACGFIDDGCGNTLNCGNCPDFEACAGPTYSINTMDQAWDIDITNATIPNICNTTCLKGSCGTSQLSYTCFANINSSSTPYSNCTLFTTGSDFGHNASDPTNKLINLNETVYCCNVN